MSARTPRAEALLPVSEVAQLWRCSVDHIYNLIAAGQLARVDIGQGRAKTRIPASELAKFVAQGRRQGHGGRR